MLDGQFEHNVVGSQRPATGEPIVGALRVVRLRASPRTRKDLDDHSPLGSTQSFDGCKARVRKDGVTFMTARILMSLGILLLAAGVQNLSGITIVPEDIEGRRNEIGATSHESIRCVVWNHWQPQDLIQCYFQVCGPLQRGLSAHLVTMSGTNTVVNVQIGGTTNKAKTLYNFVMRRDLLKDSYIDGYCAQGYFRLHLGTIPVLTLEQYDRIGFDQTGSLKALPCVVSSTTNRLGHVASFTTLEKKVEPDGAANGSQPVPAQTNRPPAAAGSGR
jgi:hypothetical protein